MTALAPCTLADLKRAITAMLLDLAAHTSPDTYGCADCTAALTGMCDDHGSKDAEATRLEQAADRVRAAEDVDGIGAALNAAVNGDETAAMLGGQDGGQ